MRKVVIGFDNKGEAYVISAPKKVEVIFKQPQMKSFRKIVRTWSYQIKSTFAKS